MTVQKRTPTGPGKKQKEKFLISFGQVHENQPKAAENAARR